MSDRLQMDPMTGDELDVFMVYERRAYIDDRLSHGGEDPLDAEAAAAKSMAEYFPDGQSAQGHFLFIRRDAATERGAREIALTVFGGNAVARGLYSSLGYIERYVGMAKPLKHFAS